MVELAQPSVVAVDATATTRALQFLLGPRMFGGAGVLPGALDHSFIEFRAAPGGSWIRYLSIDATGNQQWYGTQTTELTAVAVENENNFQMHPTLDCQTRVRVGSITPANRPAVAVGQDTFMTRTINTFAADTQLLGDLFFVRPGEFLWIVSQAVNFTHRYSWIVEDLVPASPA